MSAVPIPSVNDAAQRVLRTTAKSWRLQAPARRPAGRRMRADHGGSGELAPGSRRPCPVRFGLPLAGYGFAFSY